ncbi:MAG: Ig-like domain-containing protein [Acutalibacteraceae bacterium]
MKKTIKFLSGILFAAITMICFSICSFAVDNNSNGKWVAAWGTGPTNISLEDYGNIAFTAKDMTARTVITPTVSGDKLRIRFSNYYGEEDLVLSSVSIANCVQRDSIEPNDATSEIDTSSIKVVTFNDGEPGITIPKGKEVYSDDINFPVTALKNIAISFYAKNATEIRTMGLSGGTTFLSFDGDKTREKSFSWSQYLDSDQLTSFLESLLGFKFDFSVSYKIVRVVPCLAGIDVRSDKNAYSVAVVGDSTVANEFPLYLAQEINTTYGVTNVGVMGKGIIGNMLGGVEESLGSNLYGQPLVERFKQDVQAQSRIKYVIVKIGANDIIHPVCGENADESKQPSASKLISDLKKVCKMSHDMGAKVILCTITQWKGTTRDYFGAGASYKRTDAQFESDWQIAKDVNKWIKSSSNTYHDGYIDFVGISADKNDPAKFDSRYSNDMIHPNSDLQKLWAKSVPMGLIGVSKKVAGIKLSASSKTMYMTGSVGQTSSISVQSIIPSDAANKKVKWTTSDSSVVSITSQTSTKVNLKAHKNGTATIKCISEDSGAVASCKVTVKTHVSSVSLSTKSATLFTRGKLQLKATVSPSNASDKTVTWKTSNKTVATVSSNGLVTAVGKGTATITCTTKDSSKKATCTITVKKATDVTGIKTNVSSKSIYIGSKYQLTATVLPTNATYKTVSWKSENSKIATVDSNGLVTGVSKGTTYIVCRSKDNTTVSARIKINVLIRATGMKISPSSASVYKDATKTLTAVFTPSGAYGKEVKWKSLDKSIATINSKGVVKGVKVGKTTIVCTTVDGKLTAKCTVTVKAAVKTTKVSLNSSSKSVKVGSSFTLKATVSPSNATYKTVTWKSSNTKIAKVSSKGVVTGVKAGTATITCTTTDTGKKATCKVTVQNVTPQSVKLNVSSASIRIGSSKALKATVSPSQAANKKVKWTSSNTKVATVSSSGVVKAVGIGKATITCTTVSGGKKATCKITVTPIKASSVKLNRTSLTLDYGKTYTLTATVSPGNTTNKKVSWSSSDTKVAKVDKNGKVTAVGKGSAVITCKPADGGNGTAAKCKITVTKTDVIGVSISDTSITLSPGQKYTLLAKALPDNASVKTLTWTSSNTNIATVSSSGVVTAKSKGICFIKVTAKDGGAIARCTVYVQ